MNPIPELPVNKYEGLPMQPLRVTARMVNGAMHYDPLHLDGLLASALVDSALQGRGLDPDGGPYYIPLPLQCLWVDTFGAPLWASTDLIPHNAASDTMYMHKRALEPTMTRENLRTTQGRHKEMRRPMPVTSAAMWTADCVGNPEEIARLLATVTNAGKKRAFGMGRVAEWQIAPIDKFSVWTEDGKPRRPLPAAFVMKDTGWMPLDMSRMGWTPPYWLRTLWGMCVV